MPTNNVSMVSPDIAEIQRRNQLAQMLQQQSMTSPGNEMVSGHVVKQHPIQGIARLAQALMAKNINKENSAQLQALTQQQQQGREAALGQMGDIPPEIKAGLSSPDPFIQQLAKYQLEAAIKARDTRAMKEYELGQKSQDAAALQAERLAAQKAAQEERLLTQKQIAEQASADRRMIAGMTQSGQGKPPANYRYKQDGTLEPIPGGPADIKKQGQLNADTASMQGASTAMDRLAEAANGLKNHPGLKGITGLRGAIPNVPGTDAANAEAMLSTLKSQVAFGVLQAMRDASKTGGALGAVSEKELKLLESNLATLEKAQSFEQFQKSLDNIIKYTEESKGRIRNAYNMKHGDQQEAPAAPSNVDALLKKYGG